MAQQGVATRFLVVGLAAMLGLACLAGCADGTASTPAEVADQCSDVEGWAEYVTVGNDDVTLEASAADMDARLAEDVDACIGHATGAPKSRIEEAASDHDWAGAPVMTYEWSGWAVELELSASGLRATYTSEG